MWHLSPVRALAELGTWQARGRWDDPDTSADESDLSDEPGFGLGDGWGDSGWREGSVRGTTVADLEAHGFTDQSRGRGRGISDERGDSRRSSGRGNGGYPQWVDSAADRRQYDLEMRERERQRGGQPPDGPKPSKIIARDGQFGRMISGTFRPLTAAQVKRHVGTKALKGFNAKYGDLKNKQAPIHELDKRNLNKPQKAVADQARASLRAGGWRFTKQGIKPPKNATKEQRDMARQINQDRKRGAHQYTLDGLIETAARFGGPKGKGQINNRLAEQFWRGRGTRLGRTGRKEAIQHSDKALAQYAFSRLPKTKLGKIRPDPDLLRAADPRAYRDMTPAERLMADAYNIARGRRGRPDRFGIKGKLNRSPVAHKTDDLAQLFDWATGQLNPRSDVHVWQRDITAGDKQGPTNRSKGVPENLFEWGETNLFGQGGFKPVRAGGKINRGRASRAKTVNRLVNERGFSPAGARAYLNLSDKAQVGKLSKKERRRLERMDQRNPPSGVRQGRRAPSGNKVISKSGTTFAETNSPLTRTRHGDRRLRMLQNRLRSGKKIGPRHQQEYANLLRAHPSGTRYDKRDRIIGGPDGVVVPARRDRKKARQLQRLQRQLDRARGGSKQAAKLQRRVRKLATRLDLTRPRFRQTQRLTKKQQRRLMRAQRPTMRRRELTKQERRSTKRIRRLQRRLAKAPPRQRRKLEKRLRRQTRTQPKKQIRRLRRATRTPVRRTRKQTRKQLRRTARRQVVRPARKRMTKRQVRRLRRAAPKITRRTRTQNRRQLRRTARRVVRRPTKVTRRQAKKQVRRQARRVVRRPTPRPRPKRQARRQPQRRVARRVQQRRAPVRRRPVVQRPKPARRQPNRRQNRKAQRRVQRNTRRQQPQRRPTRQPRRQPPRRQPRRQPPRQSRPQPKRQPRRQPPRRRPPPRRQPPRRQPPRGNRRDDKRRNSRRNNRRGRRR